MKNRDNTAKENEAKLYYHNKCTKNGNNLHWCTYCESYRPKVKQISKKSYCNNCVFIQSRKIRIGKSFEEVMGDWNPECHNGRYKRLPYLKGNSNKGYEVAGFTYVDADYYPLASNWLWIKGKQYIKTSFSKDNLERIGLQRCYKVLKERKYNAVFLHRFVLGLGNDVKLVGDHISGVKLDNRFENLRYITSYQNTLNTGKKCRNSFSRYKGLSFYKDRYDKGQACWRAAVKIKDRYISKWCYSETAAAKAYDNILRKSLPNEVHKFNFPKEGELSAIK